MPRATPLAPDERRAAIIAATEPLVEQFGRNVTTKQIAEAAGIAEGTIFRVFPTKDALVDAVVDDTFDVTVTCRELEKAAADDDLETRLTAVVAVLQDRTRRLFAIFHAVAHAHQPPAEELRRRREHDETQLNATLARLLVDDAHRFRLPVERVAQHVRAITFSLSHPMITERLPMSAADIVSVILYGVTAPTCVHDHHPTPEPSNKKVFAC